MAADVVGYSRLMGDDEDGTLSALNQHRETVLEPSIAAHGGRIVKYVGDGVLAEFASVVGAVNCALDIQHAEKIVVAGPASPLIFRIGINLGDVLVQGDDIYGDGVNAAARLEAPADPGGICISANVKETIQDRVDAEFRDAGLVAAKNIRRPISSWKWQSAGVGEAQFTPEPHQADPSGKKPTVVVVRFSANGEPAGHLADGCTDAVITGLSRFSWFLTLPKYHAEAASESAVKPEALRIQFGADDQALDLIMRGRGLIWHPSRDNIQKAQELFRRAIKNQTDHGFGHADLAQTFIAQRILGWTDDLEETTQNAIRGADAALDADPHDAYALATASQARTLAGQTSDAIAFSERAINSNPYLALGHATLALARVQQEEYQSALAPGDRALDLSRGDPFRFWIRSIRGMYLLMLERYDDMLANAEALVREYPEMPTGYRQLAAALAELGRRSEAGRVVRENILRLLPDHTATKSALGIPIGQNENFKRRWIRSLVAAGLPE
jgi:tetratricopeptide (TPR) repeat protein